MLGDPKRNTVLQGQPHNCRVEGDNPIPLSTCHTSAGVAQDAVGCLPRCQGTMLTHIHFAVYQDHQVLSCRAVPWPVLLQGRVSSSLQDLAFVLAEFHTAPAGLSLQPVEVPQQQLKHIDRAPQFSVICKPSITSSRSLSKMFTDRSQDRPLWHSVQADTLLRTYPSGTSKLWAFNKQAGFQGLSLQG